MLTDPATLRSRSLLVAANTTLAARMTAKHWKRGLALTTKIPSGNHRTKKVAQATA
jgi:hypothetical protein